MAAKFYLVRATNAAGQLIDELVCPYEGPPPASREAVVELGRRIFSNDPRHSIRGRFDVTAHGPFAYPAIASTTVREGPSPDA